MYCHTIRSIDLQLIFPTYGFSDWKDYAYTKCMETLYKHSASCEGAYPKTVSHCAIIASRAM